MDRKVSHVYQCCGFTRKLLLEYTVQPEELTLQQRRTVVEHVAECESCARVYEVLSDANANLWKEVASGLRLPKIKPRDIRPPDAVIADLWAPIDADETQQRSLCLMRAPRGMRKVLP